MLSHSFQEQLLLYSQLINRDLAVAITENACWYHSYSMQDEKPVPINDKTKEDKVFLWQLKGHSATWNSKWLT